MNHFCLVIAFFFHFSFRFLYKSEDKLCKNQKTNNSDSFIRYQQRRVKPAQNILWPENVYVYDLWISKISNFDFFFRKNYIIFYCKNYVFTLFRVIQKTLLINEIRHIYHYNIEKLLQNIFDINFYLFSRPLLKIEELSDFIILPAVTPPQRNSRIF